MTKFTSPIAVSSTSLSSCVIVLDASASRCMMQCRVNTLGFFCFSSFANPDLAPNIAGVPCVHAWTSLPQSNPSSLKKALTSCMTLASWVVFPVGGKTASSFRCFICGRIEPRQLVETNLPHPRTHLAELQRREMLRPLPRAAT